MNHTILTLGLLGASEGAFDSGCRPKMSSNVFFFGGGTFFVVFGSSKKLSSDSNSLSKSIAQMNRLNYVNLCLSVNNTVCW